MDDPEDVGRLFSWLKAPMVRYREFAPQREIAEAVATWPSVHRAAVQSGAAAVDEPAPQGDAAAKERAARDRRSLPGLAPAAQYDTPPAEAEAPVPAEPGAAGAEPVAPVESYAPVEPMIAGFDEPPTPLRRSSPEPREAEGGAPGEPARYYPAPERGGLFSGEYRGREREARSSGRVADRQDRSLDAVFSRLSGTRERLPDPRGRARTSPGLGAVFGRLR